MTPRWHESSFKHGLDRDEIVHAIVHATFESRLEDDQMDGGAVVVYIGPPHSQTDREIEVLVTVYADGRDARVFHAMPLGPHIRRYRQENPHG